MKTINVNELAVKLMGINKPTPASIVTETVPGMKKTNNDFYGRVLKRSTKNVKIAFNYADEVNMQRASEGKSFDFTPNPRKWGAHLTLPDGKSTPVIVHNGQMYLECQVLKTIGTEYLCEGQAIDKTTLEPWLSKPSSSKTQELENEVIINDIKLINVKEITIGTERFVIV